MSQQAGPATTSTAGDHSKQPTSATPSSQQSAPGPLGTSGPIPPNFQAVLNSLNPQQQQQLLQQFAARLPANVNLAQAQSTLFPNLPNLTLPQGRRGSGNSNASGGGGGPANTNANGSANAASPSVSSSGPAQSPTANAPTPDVSSLQAQLQARMIAQQQALQAANARGAANNNVNQAADGDAPRPPNGIPEWAAAASANGLLSNVQPADRDAIMKQLQALQRAKQAQHHQAMGAPGGPSAPSPANPSAASPASMAAPSPAAASAAAPSPVASVATPVSAQPSLPDGAPSPAAAALAAAAGSRPPGSQQPGGPGPGRPPMRPPFPQKQQLLNSMIAFYKQTNQPLPPEVFYSEREGSFKLGDGWIELTELFFNIFRMGGMLKLMQKHPNPTEHPVWQAMLNSKGIALTLPAPVAMPRPPGTDPNVPPQMTTSAVQYLVGAYRAWIFAFEQAMARQKMAHLQKQQQAAMAAGGPSRPPGGIPGSPATPTTGPLGNMPFQAGTPDASSPARPPPNAPTPTSATGAPSQQGSMPPASPAVAIAPSPSAAAPSPAPPAPTPAPAPAPPTPAAASAPSPASVRPLAPTPTPEPVAAHTSPVAPAPAASPIPPRPRIEIPQQRGPSATPEATPATANGTPKKRKRGTPSEKSRTASPAVAVAATPKPPAPSPPKAPKRARYKVEYQPLHFPQAPLGGWDERAVASAFPKHNLGRPTRSHHDLHVDIEAVLMGLRSRLPREIGYGLTVLSMLSMPLNDGSVSSLPILPLQDVYLEVIELVAEAALGDDGLQSWLKEQEAEGNSQPRTTPSREHLARISFTELEQLGHDVDFCVPDDEAACLGPREQTGGATDIVLAGLNVIKNFSYLAENKSTMARPELFNLLAAITDVSLVRLPGEQDTSERPYSVLEFARVRREAVAVLTNLGDKFDLRTVPRPSVRAVFRLLSSVLVSGWECFRLREPGFGPSVSIRDVPPAAVLSVDRALEAFSRVALIDHNREVLALSVPADELVDLFAGLVKLFPLSSRDIEAMHSIEDYLGRVELVALAVYSLSFLAPQLARAGMRATPGAVAVLTRLVFDLVPRAPELKASPFGNLVRRVAETLGVLNGTVNPGGNAERMSFAAGGVDGKGWKFASEHVQPGWLAYDADRVLEAMGWGTGNGRVWRIDQPTFTELDALWCGS